MVFLFENCMHQISDKHVYISFCFRQMRIKNNEQLTSEEQQVAIVGRKRAVTDLRQKLKGNTTMKRSQKWREESASFRQAMETNRLVAKAEKEGKPSHYYL